MSEAVVIVEGLGKRYRIGHRQGERYVALRDVIASKLSAPRRWFRSSNTGVPARTEDFWALRDVSFEVGHGEVVGIIGRNGAGKSTLLKILSRITEPTLGRATLEGRVASLLEVGTGFHPELSGRENVFLNAAILGMTRAEIARKFDEIVAFAGVERFLDTPVKRYSSGMYVRLAFAVAAHIEPDILVIDEVLAVGDAEFQKKCLGKMHEVSRLGRTVLFVSHNMGAIQALCSRALWLEKGSVACDGRVDECVSQYLSQTVERSDSRPRRAVRLADGLELLRFEVSPNPIESGARLDVLLTVAAQAPTTLSDLSLLLYSSQEMRVAILDLRSSGLPRAMAQGDTWTIAGSIKSLPLVEGEYRFGLYTVSNGCEGNHSGLVDLRVTGRPLAASFAPYPAVHRGVVELEFSLSPFLPAGPARP